MSENVKLHAVLRNRNDKKCHGLVDFVNNFSIIQSTIDRVFYLQTYDILYEILLKCRFAAEKLKLWKT